MDKKKALQAVKTGEELIQLLEEKIKLLHELNRALMEEVHDYVVDSTGDNYIMLIDKKTKETVRSDRNPIAMQKYIKTRKIEAYWRPRAQELLDKRHRYEQSKRQRDQKNTNRH